MAWASGGDRGDAMGQRGACDRRGGVGEGADATAIGARARLAPCSGGGVPIKEYGAAYQQESRNMATAYQQESRNMAAVAVERDFGLNRCAVARSQSASIRVSCNR